MSAREVCEMAKAAGLLITQGYVYNVRNKPSPQRAEKSVEEKGEAAEVAIRRAVIKVGVIRAEQVIRDVQTELLKLVGS
jgi:hypothetical protein